MRAELAKTLIKAARDQTPARIGLGRVGDALPLSAQLDLQEAHARARDAVHGAVDFEALAGSLASWSPVIVRSRAASREEYLRRPDLGRELDEEGRARLEELRGIYDLALVIADGLSASAVNAYGAVTARAVLAEVDGYSIAPIVLAKQARVGLADAIGECLGVRITAILIGERPGLTISDSLGIYVTSSPKRGRADSERNCISNINAHGLTPVRAAKLCAVILAMARQMGRTGIDLKPPDVA